MVSVIPNAIPLQVAVVWLVILGTGLIVTDPEAVLDLTHPLELVTTT